MLELKIRAKGRRYVAPEGLQAILGAERTRQELGDMIEALMVQLDMIDGDPDLENDTSDFELSGDEKGDPAWIEWDTRGAHKEGKHGGESVARDCRENMLHEDDEDCDPAEEDDDSGQCTEDEISSGYPHFGNRGPGCEISDAGERSEEICPTYGIDQTQLVPEPQAFAEARTVKAVLDRIRAQRCRKGQSRYGHPIWPLINRNALQIDRFTANTN